MSESRRDATITTAHSFTSDATSDIFTCFTPGVGVDGRLLAQRSGEAAAQSLLNQDYAMVLCDGDGHSLSFCICDGVGSSFSGDFAATYLAGQLTRWLEEQRLSDGEESEAQASASLMSALDAWAVAAQAQLVDRAITSSGGELVREALTELRDTYGSETVFFAGRVEIAADGAAEGLFCWMGNVAARLVGTDGSSTPINTVENDANRWSTARGLRGSVRLTRMGWTNPQRLLVYTDGASHLSDTLADLDNDALLMQARALRELPGADDLTILDIAWRGDAS